MESVEPSQWLSAADCASRTGLTARALRVYEEFGLIAPRRSAGGWRQYGPHDLMKLNAIALLKPAGLSLAQIGEVTCSNAGEPTLRQILAIQLDTWNRRRAMPSADRRSRRRRSVACGPISRSASTSCATSSGALK